MAAEIRKMFSVLLQERHSLMLVLLNGGYETTPDFPLSGAPLADACVTEWRNEVWEAIPEECSATR